jgi:hypothetical protein
MCTVLVNETNKGLIVAGNRDEALTRSVAVPPREVRQGNVSALYPVDPDGGGTWVSANDRGLVVTLLNDYSVVGPQIASPRSRGHIVRELAFERSVDSLSRRFESWDFSCYRPFEILALEYNCEGEVSGYCAHWNGTKLVPKSLQVPHIVVSSARDLEAARANRIRSLERTPHLWKSPKALRTAFSSHLPGSCVVSVCMHRTDAQTHCFWCVEVEQQRISMYYVDGAPCSEAPLTPTHLQRSAAVSELANDELGKRDCRGSAA